MKRKLAFFLVLSMLAAMLTACGEPSGTNSAAPSQAQSGEASDAGNEAEAEPVTLTWVVYAEEKSETERIWTLFNQQLQEKLPNTTVEFIALDSPSYDDKSRLMVTSGEYFDIMWASNWKGSYLEKVRGGAFKPVEELINQNAPELWDAIPEGDWGLMYVGGELYGVPSHQTTLNGNAVDVMVDFYDEYSSIVDIEALEANATNPEVSPEEALRAFEPLLAKAKEVYPDRDAMTDFASAIQKNYEPLVSADQAVLAAVKKFSDDTTVYNVLESEDFKGICRLAWEWQQAGYLPNDVATYKNLPPSQWGSDGPIMRFDNYELEHPQNDANKIKLTGVAFRDIMFNSPYVYGSSGPSSANFISAQSKNPERAIKLLGLINTDSDLYNLLCWGDEACYQFEEDGTFTPNSDLYSMRDWVIGNTDNSFSMKNNADLMEANSEVMAAAPQSQILGFMFDTEPVKTEVAAVSAVVGTYMENLLFGLDKDWESTYNDMCKQAESAGIDRIVEEAQKQIDEWKAQQ